MAEKFFFSSGSSKAGRLSAPVADLSPDGSPAHSFSRCRTFLDVSHPFPRDQFKITESNFGMRVWASWVSLSEALPYVTLTSLTTLSQVPGTVLFQLSVLAMSRTLNMLPFITSRLNCGGKM